MLRTLTFVSSRRGTRCFSSAISSLENLNLVSGVVENDDEMVEIRRELHAHPELGFEETRTANLVASKLESWGITTTTGIGRTGVVGTLHGREEGDCSLGFRADMDALPIVEETGVSHSSTVPGVMHACGHDGHTTMLLGAAKHLASTRNFRGKVHFIFQPNEEGVHWPDGTSKGCRHTHTHTHTLALAHSHSHTLAHTRTIHPSIHPSIYLSIYLSIYTHTHTADGAGAALMIRDGLFDRFPCDQVP